MPVLIYSLELEKAAKAHAEAISKGDKLAHEVGDGKGPSFRVGKQIKWSKMVAECIELSSSTAQNIVASLIVDDGNLERSNRKVIFDDKLRYVGVACASHPEYDIVTVINFIGGVIEPDTPGVTGVEGP